MVRQAGLEPARLATLEPKSSVSTNFTTGAHFIYIFSFCIIFRSTFSSINCLSRGTHFKFRLTFWVTA